MGIKAVHLNGHYRAKTTLSGSSDYYEIKYA